MNCGIVSVAKMLHCQGVVFVTVSTTGQAPTNSETAAGSQVATTQSQSNPAGSETTTESTSTQSTTTTPTTTTAEAKEVSQLPDWAQTLIASTRTEAARFRTQNAELQTKVDAAEREKMSDMERLQADLDKYKDQVIPAKDQEIRKLQVQVIAGTKGAVDTDAVVALLDWKAVEAGTSISDAVDQLLSTKSYLKAPAATTQTQATTTTATGGSSTTSAAAPGGGETTQPTFTKSQIENMTAAEKERNMKAIDAAMEAGRVDWTR